MFYKLGLVLLLPALASACALVSYSTSHVKGYNGLTVEVDPGFVTAMNDVDTIAQTCGVTVWVTHAFREKDQNLDGTVVAPATYSNHLVGHAIDFNLDTPDGWCNGDCLYEGYNSYAECFLDGVMIDAGLRWGGVWQTPDPIHIDDYMNGNMVAWEALYYDLQGACV